MPWVRSSADDLDQRSLQFSRIARFVAVRMSVPIRRERAQVVAGQEDEGYAAVSHVQGSGRAALKKTRNQTIKNQNGASGTLPRPGLKTLNYQCVSLPVDRWATAIKYRGRP